MHAKIEFMYSPFWSLATNAYIKNFNAYILMLTFERKNFNAYIKNFNAKICSLLSD